MCKTEHSIFASSRQKVWHKIWNDITLKSLQFHITMNRWIEEWMSRVSTENLIFEIFDIFEIFKIFENSKETFENIYFRLFSKTNIFENFRKYLWEHKFSNMFSKIFSKFSKIFLKFSKILSKTRIFENFIFANFYLLDFILKENAYEQ